MFFNEKFEPKDDFIIHGAGQSPSQFKKYWDIAGENKPQIYMEYIKFNEVKEKLTNKLNKLKEISPNLSLQLGLNLKPRNDSEKCKEIFEGKYDDDLIYLLNELKDFKNPIFLRVGYECNDPTHSYNPENFKKAWIYIFNLIRSKNIANIALVWSVCTAFNRDINEILEYYPGDQYVNWIGNDLFGTRHFQNNRDPVTEKLCDFSTNHKKPMMIAESSAAKIGVTKGIESWNEWFVPFFDWVESHKVIKAICYISWDWGKDWCQPHWGNCRIEEDEIVREKYFERLSKKRYLHYEKN